MTKTSTRSPLAPPTLSNTDIAAWQIDLPDESATTELARHLARSLKADDMVTLSGGLGAGKTAFARALIRTLCDDGELETPSPTFTLVQIYDGLDFPIVHADLFRLKDASELDEIGWEEASEGALVIVEWPDRAGDRLPADRIDIALTIKNGGRAATLFGHGRCAQRLEQARAIHALLARAGWLTARREFLQGDASTRAYERLRRGTETAVLMISPRRPDGPAIRNGRPYSAIAKLAESVHAFIAVDRGLATLDIAVPALFASDLQAGLLLIEDLGSEPVVDAEGPIPERYKVATDVLLHIHRQDLPGVLPVEGDIDHVVPDYDHEALLIEVELLLDWYVPHIAGTAISAASRRDFLRIWSEKLIPVLDSKTTWTLRDFHSPNLIWLAERSGLHRIGVIDFQDAVLGHPAYDLVSLLQDARVTVPDDLELKLLSHYARSRLAAESGFDKSAFITAYAILGAQRATKIAGIFARLDKRDGKPNYLRHLPRIERYLVKNLQHPFLSELRKWYETHMPKLFEAGET